MYKSLWPFDRKQNAWLFRLCWSQFRVPCLEYHSNARSFAAIWMSYIFTIAQTSKRKREHCCVQFQTHGIQQQFLWAIVADFSFSFFCKMFKHPNVRFFSGQLFSTVQRLPRVSKELQRRYRGAHIPGHSLRCVFLCVLFRKTTIPPHSPAPCYLRTPGRAEWILHRLLRLLI